MINIIIGYIIFTLMIIIAFYIMINAIKQELKR